MTLEEFKARQESEGLLLVTNADGDSEYYTELDLNDPDHVSSLYCALVMKKIKPTSEEGLKRIKHLCASFLEDDSGEMGGKYFESFADGNVKDSFTYFLQDDFDWENALVRAFEKSNLVQMLAEEIEKDTDEYGWQYIDKLEVK